MVPIPSLVHGEYRHGARRTFAADADFPSSDRELPGAVNVAGESASPAWSPDGPGSQPWLRYGIRYRTMVDPSVVRRRTARRPGTLCASIA